MNFFKKYWSKLVIMTEKITEISYEEYMKGIETHSDRDEPEEEDINYGEMYDMDVFEELDFNDDKVGRDRDED